MNTALSLSFALLSPATLDACAEIARHAPDPWQPAALERALADPLRRTFVALDASSAGRPLAFASFIALPDNCDLELMAVHPDKRRQGVGAALLRHALAALAAEGPRTCLLEARASNIAALALYEKLGFKRLALRKGMYANPAEDGWLLGAELHEMTKTGKEDA